MKTHVTFNDTRKIMFEAALIMLVVLLAQIALFGFLAVKLRGEGGILMHILFFAMIGTCDGVYRLVSDEMVFAQKYAVGMA